MDISRPRHPLKRQPSFRAVLEAVPAVAELGTRIANRSIIASLTIAASDLADGFAAPPESPRRAEAHRRAWISIREIDRVVTETRRTQPAELAALLSRAQRAIDRADVLVSALLPS